VICVLETREAGVTSTADLSIGVDSEVRSILGAPGTFTQQLDIQGLTSVPPGSVGVAFLDPPKHGPARRRLARRWFTGSRIRALRPLLRAIAQRLTEGLGDATESFQRDFAKPMAVESLAALFGIPAPVWFAFHDARYISSTAETPPSRELDLAYRDFVRHAHSMVPDRARPLADGTCGTGPVTREDVSLALFADVAGIDTTATLISRVLWLLIRSGKQNASVSALAVDEALRLATPIRFVHRRVRQTAVVGDKELAPGAVIQLDLLAANRDASRFPRPNSFDPSRPNVRGHVALGFGIHTCLGGQLARLEAEIAVRTILEMRPGLQMAKYKDDDYAVVF
jgi:cytochrome P450